MDSVLDQFAPESPDDQLRRLIAQYSVPQAPPVPPAAPVESGTMIAKAGDSGPRPIAAPTIGLPAGNPSATATRQASEEKELQRLQSTGSGVEQYQHRHPILGTIARVGDAALSSIFPTVAMNIPGTSLHHQALVGAQERAIAGDVGNQEKEATTAHTAQETANLAQPIPKFGTDPVSLTLHDLMTGGPGGTPRINPASNKPYSYIEALADAKAAEDTKEDGEGKTITTDQGVMQWNPQTKRYDIAAGGAPAKPGNDFEQFYHDFITDNHLPDSAHNRLLAREQFARAGQAPQRDPQQLAIGPDGKVLALRPGMTVEKGTKTASAELKGPNAEELKRSEMAENVNENLDKLTDIVTRRPELFGPLAGRMTQGKMLVGSDDPDIGALNTIKDQLGMAQQSAHSMRNAQHVEAAANSILNGFKNGPKALQQSIQTARDSLQTFTKDVQEGNPSNRKEPETQELKPPKPADPGMKWQHRTVNGNVEWRQTAL